MSEPAQGAAGAPGGALGEPAQGAAGAASIPPPRASAGAGRLADGEWHRLYWASPLLKGGFALIAILGFILANLRERLVDLFLPSSPDPGPGPGGGPGPGDGGDIVALVYDHGQTGIALLIIAGVLILSIVAFSVAWRMHTFRISADAVEVRSGILFRHNRQARLDRIQGIHITRPFFARLFGAAKIELSVAGQDAKVDLAYLGSGQVEELRREILMRASGIQAQEAGAVASASAVADAPGLVNRRLNELLAPELHPDVAPPESVVKIPPLRLLGSLVLSEFTVFLLLVVAALILSSTWVHHALVLFLLLPSLLGSLGFYVRRFTKSARYSIAATPDGVRVGFGLLTTSNDTLPPGRIHALEVTQPILWRPFGWWMIRINRAGHASSHGSAGQHHTLLLPVGRASDVSTVLGLVLPGLAGAETRALVVGGLSASHGAGFADAPLRAVVLRPFSWRRTGYATTTDAVLLRSGFFWRRLMVVPLARLQSLHVAQGPVRRMLGLAALHFNTIAGPVRASLGVIDRGLAVSAFESLSAATVAAAAADGSHRWAEPAPAADAAAGPAEAAAGPASGAAAAVADAEEGLSTLPAVALGELGAAMDAEEAVSTPLATAAVAAGNAGGATGTTEATGTADSAGRIEGPGGLHGAPLARVGRHA
ncbi:PH domain-containing protein [Subtercola endophyticus]|uniref:PH domain-containing protein n=1 Tax=Subtercola endophyticus TaxID=2895559 RepID=UPI001E575A6E|nr:PH domain-containing protein [Subtercola endophyticus]UFS59075.1 PH domain-containing protein [Subtercola endophyticus]